MGKKSPFAPAVFPDVYPVAGVRLAYGACGIRYKKRPDVLLAELPKGTTVAGVLTRSQASSAAVDWCRAALHKGTARALVVNSGNANAFTGKAGEDAVAATIAAAAGLFGCDKQEVFVSSTGVIGEPLPHEKLTAFLPGLHRQLRDAAWQGAAEAIMTTDTFPKASSRRCTVNGHTVTITGIAKGSGMIAPNMGTLLGYIFTDAAIPAPLLQEVLAACNEKSFNSITVDGDTSTSDTVLLFATGVVAAERIPTRKQLEEFEDALLAVMQDLAQQIVKDGEGASKFVTITVDGAESEEAARIIGLTIGNSPLVKTAIAGQDPNWGRIVAAVGRSGQRIRLNKLTIRFGDMTVAENGARSESYDEELAQHLFRQSEIDIYVHVGIGKHAARVWTCDLTDGYIAINASYRS